jgi:RimJ/RimL family protein N-acetyltransferase
MNLLPTLKDDLILLRPLREDDFEPLFQIAKDPLIWEQHPCYDRYKKEVFTDFFKESLDSGGALIVMDKSNNTIIGSSRFKPVKNVESAIEIGWSFLSREYWGGMYNGAMKKLMIDYALEEVENIVFYIGKDNLRSQKAVEKIGAVRITDEKYRLLIKESPDDWTYLINKPIN